MERKVEWLIIGAGPAGLQLGYFCEQNKLDYLILEKNSNPGDFYKKFPRHKQLISINKVHTGTDDPALNLRWDWNSLLSYENELLFKKFSLKYFPPRSSMCRYLREFAKHYHLKIKYNVEATSIRKEEGFIVETGDNQVFTCDKLFVGTGMFLPYLPNIPGILFAKTYVDMPVDPKAYTNKRVLIIGKGNSGLETANNLLETASLIHVASPTPPKMAWRSHYVGHIRAINNHFLETYQLKSQNAVVNTEITKIEFKENKYEVTFNYTKANGEVESLIYDEVIVCTGFKFDLSIFDKSNMPETAINGRYPKLTSAFESTNIKDLYFIGATMHMRDFKKKQSGFIHGFRYNISFLFKLLQAERNKALYPHETLPEDVMKLSKHIIARVNKTSSLWQQTGFLADVVVYNLQQKTFLYFTGIPLDFVVDGNLVNENHFFAITLEFGQERIDQYANVFGIERIHKENYEQAHLSLGLHPVVRHYHQGMVLSEHHLIEDFANVWAEPVHEKPLIAYLQKEISELIKEPEKVVESG